MSNLFNISNGNNMPIQAPLIPDPFVPYECLNQPTLTAVCKADKNTIKKYLEPTPFEYVDDKLVVTVTDFGNCDKGSFMDCGIIVPISYKGTKGGFFLFEYEDKDWSIAAGRELWGYPKKYAKAWLEETKQGINASVIKKGKEIIKLTFDFNELDNRELPEVITTPHLNIHTIPSNSSSGVFSQRIISRDTSPDLQVKSVKKGKIDVELNSIENNPLADFFPLEVYGGTYTIADFYATEKNGWGKTIDILK